MQSQGRLSVTGSGLQVIGWRGWVVEDGVDWVVESVGGWEGEVEITVGL